MQIRKICLTAAMIAIVLFIAASVGFLAYISPPEDVVEFFNYPPEFFCVSTENRIDYQTEGKCAAYAAAYLLRHFGAKTDGEGLASEIHRAFGFVPANSVADVLSSMGIRQRLVTGALTR